MTNYSWFFSAYEGLLQWSCRTDEMNLKMNMNHIKSDCIRKQKAAEASERL